MKRIGLIPLVSMVICIMAQCVSPTQQEGGQPSQQSVAQQTILEWMTNNDDYPSYAAIGFGELTPRHERTDRTLQLTMQIEEEELKSDEGSSTLDSLNNLLDLSSGPLLGYIILHQYQTTSMAGEVTNHESLFFLDSTLRVGAILNPEAFDLILDEKIFYQPEAED